MAIVRGKVVIDKQVGIIGYEVPAAALAGLLCDANFKAERGTGNIIGRYADKPVSVLQPARATKA